MMQPSSASARMPETTEMRKPLNETVLVTGSEGFIGLELAQHLLSQGFNVIGASRAPSAKTGQKVPLRRLPCPDSPDEEFDALLEGVDHVVHLAGIAHTQLKTDATTAYHQANVVLTDRLAAASARRLNGKFIFISSIRAQCGSTADSLVRETDTPSPTDLYGQSKLAAEKAVAGVLISQRYTVLRPVVVYGRGVRGNMRSLVALAKLPFPLPFAGLIEKRSFLSRSALCSAIAHCLVTPDTDGRTFIVADRSAVSASEAVKALRRGLDKAPRLFWCSPILLRLAAQMFGQGRRWKTLSGKLVVSVDALERTGWQPVEDSIDELRQIAAYL